MEYFLWQTNENASRRVCFPGFSAWPLKCQFSVTPTPLDAGGKAVHLATLPLCSWMFLILEMTVSEHKGGPSLLKAGRTLRPPPHQAL